MLMAVRGVHNANCGGILNATCGRAATAVDVVAFFLALCLAYESCFLALEAPEVSTQWPIAQLRSTYMAADRPYRRRSRVRALPLPLSSSTSAVTLSGPPGLGLPGLPRSYASFSNSNDRSSSSLLRTGRTLRPRSPAHMLTTRPAPSTVPGRRTAHAWDPTLELRLVRTAPPGYGERPRTAGEGEGERCAGSACATSNETTGAAADAVRTICPTPE